MFRAVGRTEILEMPVLYGGHNLPPLVEIGLTDLTKSGGTELRFEVKVAVLAKL